MSDHVLVPFDGSPLAEQALEFALENHPDATVVVYHVVNPADPGYGEAVGLPVNAEPVESNEELESLRESVAERVVDRAVPVAEEYGRDVETATARGDPARELLDYVDSHDVDHVVMGSHGRTGLDRLLLGSVSETVVRRSPVTVTVVRP